MLRFKMAAKNEFLFREKSHVTKIWIWKTISQLNFSMKFGSK